MRSTLLLHTIGGKDQFTAFFQCLCILVHGHGNSGAEEEKFVAFRNSLSLNTTIRVSGLADHERYTKG